MFEALTKKEISRPTKAWDTRVRTCLNDQVYADPKYEKENYADFYSGLFSESTSDLMCEFALQSSVENYANLSLENPDPEDDHPGDLFRLLHIHYIQSKGKMAPACLEALKELGEPTPPFKNCFAIQ